VSESNTNSCLAAKELKDAGTRGTGQMRLEPVIFLIKLYLMRGTASEISALI
jgi:hypothetical protein